MPFSEHVGVIKFICKNQGLGTFSSSLNYLSSCLRLVLGLTDPYIIVSTLNPVKSFAYLIQHVVFSCGDRPSASLYYEERQEW